MAKRKYTDEHIDYLRELSAQGLFNAEITRLFNEKFGTKRTENAIQQQRCKYGFKTDARYYWQKGHKPWNKGMKGIDIGGKATRFKKATARRPGCPLAAKRSQSMATQK